MSDLDQIIEEIRRSRCRMSEQCGHDLRQYLERLKTFNRRYAPQVEKYRKSRTGVLEFGSSARAS